MDVCGLPKARPISCNDCPAFQRRHTSVLCAAESPTRFPRVINTTFYIRWCCIDLLSSHDLPGTEAKMLRLCLFLQRKSLTGFGFDVPFRQHPYTVCRSAAVR